ncbi:glycerophosphodiester phosphodiesterase [Atopococcus tabaci]|uniref:glycerophosphodiester phosphodiesterase n=1 Tax=Atopococcus tabaci TaxID=269774 RepID=UPI002409F180|nr:glycerophosphodiester phosphodiesterase [Atopococcus tabaci]
MRNNPPLNIAHRGFSGNFPENTMLAFEKAYETGVDGIELDVQMTKDQELVIIHDSTVDRTTDGTGYVKDLTLEDIRGLNAGAYDERVVEKEPVPTLEQYLIWAADKELLTNIELKTNIFEYPGIEQKVVQLVEAHQMEDRIVFSSFNHFTVQRMKALNPSLRCGLLCSDWVVGMGRYTRELGVECVHPAFYMLQNGDYVTEIQEKGLDIHTWTINDEEWMRKAIEAGVTSIITNFPDQLNAVLTAQ